MKKALFYPLLLLMCLGASGQARTDNWLRKLFEKQGSPLLKHILNHPDSFRYQLMYTRIDRDAENRPRFTHFHLNVDDTAYFNPASTVKLPTLLAALEKLNRLQVAGLDKHTPMFTDSAYPGQTRVRADKTAPDSLPSVAHYGRKILIVSDNDAYNRLYEWNGQQYLNEWLQQKGYTGTRITRRFVRMSEEANRHTNPVRFARNGLTLYEQPAAYSRFEFDFSKKHLVGSGFIDSANRLVDRPMDFTTHNLFPIRDMNRMLLTLLFPETVEPAKRFGLTEDDYRFVYRSMSQLPFESRYPRYDTSEFFNSYTKFFFFRAGKQKPPQHIRVFNKAGWTYGFLTDNAYIVDFENNIEFVLTATIYTNADGVLNDDRYDYESVGYPFFRETGRIIYEYERARRRKHQPDLSRFRFSYSE